LVFGKLHVNDGADDLDDGADGSGLVVGHLLLLLAVRVNRDL
jgi:hypothetical protein